MEPRLAAVAGPLKGAVFALPEAEFAIGRSAANQLSINDPGMSRRHCLIESGAGVFKIRDLDSRNCTFVNDVPVKLRVLEHGDRIKVAGSQFVFLLHEDDRAAAASAVQLDEAEWVTERTISLPAGEAPYVQTANRPEAPASTARVARDLQALLKIGTVVNSSRSLEALGQGLLTSIFEVVPAERGAILLLGEGPGGFASVLGRTRAGEPEGAIRVSRTIVQRVITEGVAVLANDVLAGGQSLTSRSLLSQRIASVLCVPLSAPGERLGALYLDAQDPASRFEAPDLDLVTAAAAVAALAVKNVKRLERLEEDNRRLRADIDLRHDMVGETERLREVQQFIEKVAPTDSTVLICGESGTGKELVARAIHRSSPRCERLFAAINCAAITETLLESELFGHEKGAFTGAVAQKKGRLEVADGGTVFLDEVGELATPLQAKLLRVLQEQAFERVGGTRTVKVDLRLIAATNKVLEEAVRAGSFRRDLYYRLNVVSIRVPPLRERREDIPLLAGYFVAKYAAKAKRRILGLSDAARRCLLAYDWPGNVRELENAVERAVVLGSTDVVLPEDLPEAVLEAQPFPGPSSPGYVAAVREAKKRILMKAMGEAEGSYSEAARLLGMHVNNLHRLIRNLGLKPEIKGSREQGDLR
jgi:Nif-specific regulatory protein